MNFKNISLLFLSAFISYSPLKADDYKAPYASETMTIDGKDDEAIWSNASWSPIDQLWDGKAGSPENCTAKYKAVWNNDRIFVLVEVTDDVFVNWHPDDPLNNYYANDCIELFIDEDKSGGDHQTNYNAFAYHISTTTTPPFEPHHVIDIGTDGAAHLYDYDESITTALTKNGSIYTWECSMKVFTDAYVYGNTDNPLATLYAGKILGFSVAYNDSDLKADTRERQLGSQEITRLDPTYGKNVSWLNADYFGSMELLAEPLGTNEPGTKNANPIRIIQSDVQEIFVTAKSGDQITITDMMGRLVVEQTLKESSDNYLLSLPELAIGSYVISLQGKNSGRTKFVVSK